MTASKPDPLAVLDQMLNDILIHTGKTLKSTLKDGSVGAGGASGTIRRKTSETMVTYHDALDDLESEITRAKAVLMRDLEKLRAARLPAPVPAPQPAAAQAPVVDIPSAAAHTSNPPPFVPNVESKPVAPFPDMGTGDVVDLTGGDKKPSPRVSPGTLRQSAQSSPSLKKGEVKPSPKATPKTTPKATPPSKVTPVPPPQIPRPPQPAAGGPTGSAQPAQSGLQRKQSVSNPVPRSPAPHAAQGASTRPSAGKPGGTNAAPSGGELNFTDMQFTLAPSANESQNAPPAPMPEFDLTTFAPQDGNNNLLSMENSTTHGADGNGNATAARATGTNNAAPSQAPKEAAKPAGNLDDLFNLDNGSGGGDNLDLDLDLGTGGASDNNFDELFSYTNDADMGQFDNAYFGLE
ncbi:hypothetical protein DL764_000669 [Monosporascus ibericus]|uniref:Uncharacterized protein n=1 Tax=Monosporascus ibericus TaxID=155417 RepID=A0A4Q4TSQ3_9PEZI|nr:hypothetical protein DL764_000669 [Monosporascus ibericus]